MLLQLTLTLSLNCFSPLAGINLRLGGLRTSAGRGPAFWSCDPSFWKHKISQWSSFLSLWSVWRMSVNIPNASSWYFYLQLFRVALTSQQCVPSLARGDLGERWGANFVWMLTSAFHQNHFFGRWSACCPAHLRHTPFPQRPVITLQQPATAPVLSATLPSPLRHIHRF